MKKLSILIMSLISSQIMASEFDFIYDVYCKDSRGHVIDGYVYSMNNDVTVYGELTDNTNKQIHEFAGYWLGPKMIKGEMDNCDMVEIHTPCSVICYL
jgi:hypothetical protein